MVGWVDVSDLIAPIVTTAHVVQEFVGLDVPELVAPN
jgi:hypothetical protein